MGLYGNVLVEPADPDYWPPVHRELALTLDDVLIEDGQVAPFSRAETTYAAMGRFGNVLLVAGEPELALTAQLGEVVRLYLTNTANTRVFKVALPGARMKLVGGDSGRVEHEQFVEDVILAPSERVVVDVLFDRAGELALEHHTPDRIYPLAAITVSENPAEPPLAEQFAVAAHRPGDGRRARARSRRIWRPSRTRRWRSSPRWTWTRRRATGRSSTPARCTRRCDEEPGRCPQCGMKLIAIEAPATTYTCPMHPEVVSEQPGRCPECGMKLLPAQLVGRAPAATTTSTTTRTATSTRPRPRGGRRHRVGGRHGRGQPADHAGEHALEAGRPRRPTPRTTRSTGGSASATG